MVSSEVQRTLVKSPPELWAELGDPAALARHLGELGEIRIVKTKPEERVEWEADGAAGTVLIKASGWGTKVTLSVNRELDVSKPESHPAEEPEAAAESEAAAEPEAAAATEDLAEPEAPAEPTPPEPVVVAPEPVAIAAAPTTEPRRGFFARLFGRRKPARTERSGPVRNAEAASELDAAQSPVDEAASQAALPASEQSGGASAIESLQARFQPEEQEPVAVVPSERDHGETSEQAERPEDLAAELKVAEEAAIEEVTAILTAALDRLGAAHHRPFSRS